MLDEPLEALGLAFPSDCRTYLLCTYGYFLRGAIFDAGSTRSF